MCSAANCLLRVPIGGLYKRASTQLAYAGAYSVTLSTTLPALPHELHSAYLGHAQTPTSVAHLILMPDVRELQRVEHDAGALPLITSGSCKPRSGCVSHNRDRLPVLLDVDDRARASSIQSEVALGWQRRGCWRRPR